MVVILNRVFGEGVGEQKALWYAYTQQGRFSPQSQDVEESKGPNLHVSWRGGSPLPLRE